MSILTRDMFASAASSPYALTAGTVADPVRLTWREVHDQAKRMAGGLAARGVGRHSSVAVLANDAADVAPLAQAIWMRRAALTMLQQPTPRTDLAVWLDDTVRAIRMIRPDVVVVGEPFLMVLDHLVAQNLAVRTVESLRGGVPIEPDDADEADIAMRQLTSGSTGVPKAVEISHANFATNTVAMCNAMDIETDKDVTVSWLPLSHDMGMIAFLCVPMQLGGESVVVRPEQFLRRPIIWAQLISRHRATSYLGPQLRVFRAGTHTATGRSHRYRPLVTAGRGEWGRTHRSPRHGELRRRRCALRPETQCTDARLRACRSHPCGVVRGAARSADRRPGLPAGCHGDTPRAAGSG